MQLKQDNMEYELIDDTSLYEIGFSKKSGKMKSDYPSKYNYISFL